MFHLFFNQFLTFYLRPAVLAHALGAGVEFLLQSVTAFFCFGLRPWAGPNGPWTLNQRSKMTSQTLETDFLVPVNIICAECICCVLVPRVGPKVHPEVGSKDGARSPGNKLKI